MKPNFDREALRAQYAMIWRNDDRMTNYCTKKTAAVAMLPAGEIIPIDKQQIETRFCFGESGYDYADALRAADHARHSADHFRRENLSAYDRQIDALREALTPENGTPHQMITIHAPAYYNQPAECKIAHFQYTRLTDILDALGGSAYISELPGQRLTVCGRECRIATRKEIEIILAAYEIARAEHAKKIESYLKRYGTSKVHAWTYWRDA